MLWKFILFICFLIAGAVFTGLNLENACNVNFGFKSFERIPVYLTILFSFLSGILVALPFVLGKKKERVEIPKELVCAKKDKKSKPEKTLIVEPVGNGEILFADTCGAEKNAKSEKVGFFKKNKRS